MPKKKKSNQWYRAKNRQSAAHARRAESRRLAAAGKNEVEAAVEAPCAHDASADEPCASDNDSSVFPEQDADQLLEEKDKEHFPGLEVNPELEHETSKPATVNEETQTSRPIMMSIGIHCSVAQKNVGTNTTVETRDVGTSMVNPESMLRSIYQQMKLVLSENWYISFRGEVLYLLFMSDSAVPKEKITIRVLSNGDLEVLVHGHKISNDHVIWDIEFHNNPSINEAAQDLWRFILKVENHSICEGITLYDYLWQKGTFAERGYVDSSTPSVPSFRATSCFLLVENNIRQCKNCRSLQTDLFREHNRLQKKKDQVHDKSKINLRFLTTNELQEVLQDARKENTKHRKEIAALRQKINTLIKKNGRDISMEWSQDFENITKANFEKMTPLQKMFWDQQMRYASLKTKSSMRWHPAMIRLALNFQMTSSSAYENVRNANFITLPSKRTLYDYSHLISSKEGCQEEILSNLREQFDSKCRQKHERYVCLMFDEMQIKSNLVYHKSTGDLVGYTKLDNVEMEFSKFESELAGSSEPKLTLAKKILVFMVRNITCNERARVVKGVVAVYSTSNLTAAGLYSKVWEVIYQLECSGIPVLVLTCDGASTNRSFFKMHAGEGNEDVFKTVNKTAPEDRPIFFVVDVPHILKCMRNCFANSYAHKKSRILWNNEDISWELIVKHYRTHMGEKFRKSLLKKEHVELTSFSVMKVSFASAVMSRTLAEAIEEDAEDAAKNGRIFQPYKETVTFMRMVNDFFDCLNGHNVTSHIRFKNPNLAPYTSFDDQRFEFLEKGFLGYFEKWEENVKEREGNWKKNQRKKMVISDQTSSAIHITVPSIIGAMKFLLLEGAEAICGRRFCQDPLEQNFGMMRMKGGSSDNPDLIQALHTRINIHAQGQAALPNVKGNTEVEEEVGTQTGDIDDRPLPKRKRTKK